MTAVGATRAPLLLEIVTTTSPAGLDKVTAQFELPPTITLVAVQVIDNSVGVDQSVNEAVRDDAPNVAVIVPARSAVMVPALAVKDCAEVPAGTTRVAGVMIRGELGLRVIVVSVGAVWERVAVHVLAAADIRPPGLQTSELRVIDAASAMGSEWDEPL